MSDGEEATTGRPLPRTAAELARDLRYIQMELLMTPDGTEGTDDEEDA